MQNRKGDVLLCNCDGFWHVSLPDDSDMLNTVHYIGNMEEAVIDYIQEQAEDSDLVAKHPDICSDISNPPLSPLIMIKERYER